MEGPTGLFTTIRSLLPPGPGDVDYIQHNDAAVVFVVYSRYFDGAGNGYWDDICLVRRLNGAIGNCPKHNELH